MHGDHSEQLDTILYMNKVHNPLCTVHEITKHITGRYTDSNDSDYQRVYRMLEKMAREKLLFRVSTVNGGNVYVSRGRVINPVTNNPNTEADNGDLPF